MRWGGVVGYQLLSREDIAETSLVPNHFSEIPKETSSGQLHNSKYFALSFQVPTGLKVIDYEDAILISNPEIPNASTFFELYQYDENDTHESQLAYYRKHLVNIQESTIDVDGLSLPTLNGDQVEDLGYAPGKFLVIFFPNFWVEISDISGRGNSTKSIEIGRQILSTFRFTR